VEAFVPLIESYGGWAACAIVAGLFVAYIIIGGWKRWYVWGWQHQGVVEERDFWRGRYLLLIELAEHAVEVGEDAAAQ